MDIALNILRHVIEGFQMAALSWPMFSMPELEFLQYFQFEWDGVSAETLFLIVSIGLIAFPLLYFGSMMICGDCCTEEMEILLGTFEHSILFGVLFLPIFNALLNVYYCCWTTGYIILASVALLSLVLGFIRRSISVDREAHNTKKSTRYKQATRYVDAKYTLYRALLSLVLVSLDTSRVWVMASLVVYSFSPIIYVLQVMPHVKTTLNCVRVGVFLFSWCLNVCGCIALYDPELNRLRLFFLMYPAVLLIGTSFTLCRAWQLKRRLPVMLEKCNLPSSSNAAVVTLENDQAVDRFIKGWKGSSSTLRLIAGDGLTHEGCNRLLGYFHSTNVQLLCLSFSKFDLFPSFLVEMASSIKGKVETLEMRNNGLDVETAARVAENLSKSNVGVQKLDLSNNAITVSDVSELPSTALTISVI